jgi:type I restriction enzyme S subunit
VVKSKKSDNLSSDIQYSEMPKETVKWCSVKLSEIIKYGLRLEAEVYNLEGRYARQFIIDGRYGSVSFEKLIKKAYYPGRFKRIYCDSTNGTHFFLPSQLNDIYPKSEKNISALTKCNISDLKLKLNDVLVTRSGTVGSVTIVSKTLENSVFSDDVIRITPNEGLTGYLYAYLRTDAGNSILKTNQYGSVIQHIEPEHLAQIPIPNPPDSIKHKINDLVLRSFELRDESNEMIDKATAMLIEELQLPSINKLHTKHFDNRYNINNYTVKLSELDGRMDASYHVPIVKAIVSHLRSHSAEVTTVGDNRISKEIILPGRFKRVYVEKGRGRTFIGGKQILELDPTGKKYLSLSHHAERINKQLELHSNMTLITCSGTIGKVALVPQHWEKWTASQHIIRIVPKNLEIAGYNYIFLSTNYGKNLITHFTYGSVVDEIDDKHVSQIPIPLLKNTKKQCEINSLALQASDLRYQAYVLEQEALKIMNEEVLQINA